MADGFMQADEAIQHIMKSTGKSRRQAQALLMSALKAGRVRSFGKPVIDGEVYEEEPIPVEFWRGVASEH
jgi:hypothetical protein